MAFQITRIDTVHPQYEAFVDDITQGKLLDRTYLVQRAADLSGVKIFDVGNTTYDELVLSLRTLVNRRLNNMPDREGCMPNTIKNIAIGHASGSGEYWCFANTGIFVHDYVNQNIPKNEAVWVLACESGVDRLFSKLGSVEKFI
jgi:hypothetical protein